MPDEHARHDRLVTAARRPGHGSGLRRLEGKRQAEGDGGDQVDPQDLHRRHRKGKAQQGENDRHGLAGIGRQRPADDFPEVVIDGAALAHGGGDRGEIVVGQHQIGGFLGGLRALEPHGDAGIGALQRGRVVHPVAGHGDRVAIGLQRHDEAQLVLRAGAGEDIDTGGLVASSASSS